MGNLLRNALHYTDRGFIRLSLMPTGFTVEDSGVGIPEENAKRCSNLSCEATRNAERVWAWTIVGTTDL